MCHSFTLVADSIGPLPSLEHHRHLVNLSIFRNDLTGPLNMPGNARLAMLYAHQNRSPTCIMISSRAPGSHTLIMHESSAQTLLCHHSTQRHAAWELFFALGAGATWKYAYSTLPRVVPPL